MLQFTQIFMTYANLKEPLLLYPDLSNSTQVLTKLFQLPKFDWANVSDCIQISVKLLYITQIGMKLFEAVQI